MTARKVTTEREEPKGSGTRPIGKRHLPFAGLFLAPFGALLIAWLIHLWTRGFDLVWQVSKYRPIDWHWRGNGWAFAGTIVLLAVAAAVLAYVSWPLSDSRRLPLRIMLTVSAGATTLVFLWAVVTGPGVTPSFFQVLFWWGIAAVWVIPRLDVTRRDARPGDETRQDPIEERLGLVGHKYLATPVYLTRDGERVRTDVKVTHPPGGTIKPLQDAIGGIESLADSSGLGAPPGMSTVRPDGGASRSLVQIIHKDILVGGVRYQPPALKPDGSRYTIDEIPLVVSQAIDMELGTETMRSTQGVMGTTGAGKSVYARVKITAMSTRDWVAPVLYFDKVKGRQTAAPMVHALGTIVLSNDPAPHVAGIKAARRMVEYRADLLGDLGYDEWQPGIVDRNGDPVPKLILWFEESDTLIVVAPRDMVFLSGKARSTGVVPVWSMQRPDHKQMPTELRANIVNWSVFGVMPADDQSADFALDDDVQAQGAKPLWGDSKPGYHFRTERETPRDRWPVVRRVADASRDDIWSVTSTYGPGMMPLDAGTIAATGGWYEQAAAEADAIKASMSEQRMRRETDTEAAPVTSVSPVIPMSPAAPGDTDEPTLDFSKGGVTTPGDTGFSDDDGDDMTDTDTDEYVEDAAEVRQEIETEMREMLEDGTIPLNPDLDGEVDIDTPIPAVAPGDDESWEDEIGGLPPAKDRAAALRALFEALALISVDPTLRHPDPNVTVFGVHDVYDRWPFRSRPWFSKAFVAVVTHEEEIPEEYGLALYVGDEDDEDGAYHLHRVAATAQRRAAESDGE